MIQKQQQSSLPSQLVCGRKITTSAEQFNSACRNGQVIYFCTEYCLEAYHADPERFYKAHSQRKKDYDFKPSD